MIRILPTPFLAPTALALVTALASQQAAAQSSGTEVVQALPTPQVQRLNRALMELARRPNRVSTLLEAGDASLDLGDFDAAIGFYGRAANIEPENAQVKLGLARVYLRSGRPLEAIPLFAQARNSGAPARDFLADQALAFDMIGDGEAARAAYVRAIELAPQDDEARRRLAINHAISGNNDGFNAVLAPLIEARDPAAIRTRAFGLAILGEQERAEGIVNASMPADLAARINPYLAFMPRLTSAQQAAAANLGIFPRAADIGREDPRIARFSREAQAGALLEPSGEPLGAPVETVSQEVTQQAPEEVAAQSEETNSPTQELPDIATTELAETSAQSEAETTARAASVADAFADFDIAEMPQSNSSSEAVDLASIEIPRETAREPEPVEPAHPRRIWVQLATGRDVDALRFDWRRFVRTAPELLSDFEPHVTPWGQANRLLAGPLDSRSDARELVNALAQKGLATFSYTSSEGTEIQRLRR